MPFPRKRLMFEQLGVDQGLLDEMLELKKFLRGIDDTSPTWLAASGAAKHAFLPQSGVLYTKNTSCDAYSSNSVDRSTAGKNNFNNSLSELKSNVYKVNCPGFIHRIHYSGSWVPSPEYMILVAYASSKPNSVDKLNALNWICLFRTRGMGAYGSDTGGANHANNMFPINPGEHTYIQIISGEAFHATAAARNYLMFEPAFGAVTSDGKPLSHIGYFSVNLNTKKLVPADTETDGSTSKAGTHLSSIISAFK